MERLVRLNPGEWSVLAPLLPAPSKKGGRPAKPHRPMIEAMHWILRTGAPWRDLPSAYGPWQSVYTRFSRWSESGVIAALVAALSRDHDDEGYSIDATIVRAHQDASGAAKEGAPRNRALARRSVHEDSRRGGCSRQSRARAAHARANA
jgi:putative transposase